MRVRAQDESGDYTFGHGLTNFLINSVQAVEQLILTRLLLFQGEWFLDNTEGTAWNTQVLGKNTQSVRDMVIQQRILQTPGVSSIVSYQGQLNGRNYVVTGQVQTRFSATLINFGPATLILSQ